MKKSIGILTMGVAWVLAAGCTQADYDRQHAASGAAATPPAADKPIVTKEQVTNNANNVAGAVNTGASQFGNFLKTHGFKVTTKDDATNRPTDGK